MKKFEFTKMVAAGNDFVVLDAVSAKIAIRAGAGALAKKMCDRREGIGADGLLILEPSKKADFRMLVFNPDGSEGEMCGNGLRCAVLFAREKNIVRQKDMAVETKAGIYRTSIKDSVIKIAMLDPKDCREKVNLSIGGNDLTAHYIDTGVPHAVIFGQGIDGFDVEGIGRAVRNHTAFKPRGANVDFVELCPEGLLKIRTYERGVEAETLACGTGAVASAIVAALVHSIASPVKVLTKSGEALAVSFTKTGKTIVQVSLEGSARIVFEGNWAQNQRG